MTVRPVRTVRTRLAVAVVAAAVAATALVTPATAAEPRQRTHHSGSGHERTQRALEQAVEAGSPGALAQAARAGHPTWNGEAGVADRTTGSERKPEDRFRVGSITKTFVATVILQLEAEGRLSLDDTVERWLPGLVRGNGHDGRSVTLRQLLNHTSGIFNYTDDDAFVRKVFGEGFFEHRYDTWAPRDLVRTAMGHEPYFAPGTDWRYSNTNYVLAGLVIEKVTSRPYGQELERRVLRPLGLRATSSPGTRPGMPRPSGRAYSVLVGPEPGTAVHDVTELNASAAWSAGEMISTTGDLNRFYRALLTGKVLPKGQVRKMTTTVPMGEDAPGLRYGLGLMAQKLSCGKEVWGHSGGIHGSSSEAVTTPDGRHALALNFNSDWAGDGAAVVEAEFCRR
ncbi:serine hydrolase domain-containing protein [Streptomyces sp. NPDC091376]|uniref:serine hydrolase domain-containing protein n=1 Tax=Streptomyces sp. NPDC091376 TaxID=3365994 RepID=UPI0038180B00